MDVAVYACRFRCWILGSGVGRALCLLRIALLLFVLSLRRLCVFFQCFSFFSHLCSCVDQTPLDLIKIVFVIGFLLIKNVLGREKRGLDKLQTPPLAA